MISVIYKNPNRKFSNNGYVPFHQQHRNGQSPWMDTKPTIPTTPPAGASVIQLPAPETSSRALPLHTTLHEAVTRAARVGISTAEWQRRDAVVRRLFAENSTWRFMDSFYPLYKKDYEELGMCHFVGAVSSYKEIDHQPWPEDDEVMIFTGRSHKAGNDFVCNLKYMSKQRPTE